MSEGQRGTQASADVDADADAVTDATRHWVERVVVGLNLCPFARRELDADRVRFVVSEARDRELLLEHLQRELMLLEQDPAIETTLLIHPAVLEDFLDYNDFLAVAERLLRALDFEGVYQVASFHPQYRFAGTMPEDAENYSNRSPYPMLHLLREESVARAVESHPSVESIPETNIARLNELGAEELRRRWQSCVDDAVAAP